nr:hypothetical protein [Pseudomonas sp. Hg5Tf]MDH2559000.1 hypothetical protein [Pseudomonas sp. Hg5Tf]
MSSVVDICNMALSRIGVSQRIDDLEEASLEAEQCSLFYEHSRDFVLRADCDWGFATAFSDLAEVTENPDPGYQHAYAMPVDCMRARRIVNQTFPVIDWPYCDMQAYPQFPEIKFRVINGSSNRLIATNVSPAKLEYTLKVESPEMFDPIFVSALAWKLGANIAPALSRDASTAGSCEGQYREEIRALLLLR